MSETKHNPEPWRIGPDGLVEDAGGVFLFHPGDVGGDSRARRIVACVNACEGLTDEQVAAIPRPIAWYRNWFWRVDWNTPEAAREYVALGRIFGGMPVAPDGADPAPGAGGISG